MEIHEDPNYWRGRVDTRLENMDNRVGHLEVLISATHKEITIKLDHLHDCFEKRGKTIYMLLGALGALYVVLQIAAPLILRLITKV